MKKIARQWIIIDGKIPDVVLQFIRNQKGKMILVFKEYKEQRTLKQNAFYRAYLTIIAQDTGDDEDSLHEYFKRTCLPGRKIKAMGKEILIPTTTTKLTKGEFGDYIRKIEVMTGILAPDPNDLYL